MWIDKLTKLKTLPPYSSEETQTRLEIIIVSFCVLSHMRAVRITVNIGRGLSNDVVKNLRFEDKDLGFEDKDLGFEDKDL